MEKEQSNRIGIKTLVRQSYAAVFENGPTYLRIIWLPFLILFVVGMGMLVLEVPFDTRVWSSIAFKWGMFLVLVPVVTSWHRLILIGPESRVAYRFQREEWLYIKVLIGVGVTVYLLSIVLGLLFTTPLVTGISWIFGNEAAEWIAPLVLWLVLFLLVCRFLLVLPAAALGESMAFAKSSTTFHGSALRFTAAYFLALLVPDVLLGVVGDPAMWLMSGPESGHGLLFIAGMFALGLMITLAFWVVSVGVISFAYKALVVENAT